jgi:signal transduction histidine kinase
MMPGILIMLLLYNGMAIALPLFVLWDKHKADQAKLFGEKKKRRLENEKKEFEKQVAIIQAKQQERNRISADMHDELGSGVTAIRLMSEMLKSKMNGQGLPEIEKISHSANELLLKMNVIIWTLVSSNDTVESLADYIRNFAEEFFENTTIECHFTMPVCYRRQPLNADKRKNIFLCVKEILHNTLKHSRATEVFIQIRLQQKLVIEIQDDGIGILPEKSRPSGNGLSNIQKRMLAVNGTCIMENKPSVRTILETGLDDDSG